MQQTEIERRNCAMSNMKNVKQTLLQLKDNRGLCQKGPNLKINVDCHIKVEVAS